MLLGTMTLIGVAYAAQESVVAETTYVRPEVEMTEAEKIAAQAQSREMLDKKIREIKDEVMNRIKYGKNGTSGESAGHRPKEGSVFYANDPRDALESHCSALNVVRNIECDSWGEWQFKILTVIHYMKELYGQDVSQVDALVIALDKAKADALAEKIIFEVKGGVWNWSVTKGDEDYYNEKITLVRELEVIRNGI